jgi:hypothetical protein
VLIGRVVGVEQLEFNQLVLRTGMDADVVAVDRRGVGTGIDLGLNAAEAEVGEIDKLTAPDYGFFGWFHHEVGFARKLPLKIS